MSKALVWKLPKDVSSGEQQQRGRRPIELSPVIQASQDVLPSPVVNDGGSRTLPEPQPEQLSLLADIASPQQQALPLPALDISGHQIKGTIRKRRTKKKSSTVAAVHSLATTVAALDDQKELKPEQQPPKSTRKCSQEKKNDHDPEEGKEKPERRVNKGKEAVVASDHEMVITKDDFVQNFMNLRPRTAGNKPKNHVDDKKMEFSLTLTKKEIEEDFLAMTGKKPRPRPKKRPSIAQKSLKNLIIGVDLDLVCPEAYAVEEEKTPKRI